MTESKRRCFRSFEKILFYQISKITSVDWCNDAFDRYSWRLGNFIRLDFAAGDFCPGVSRRLRCEVIRHTMDDQSSPNHFLRQETICVEHGQSIAIVSKQRWKISRVLWMPAGIGVKVITSIRKGIFFCTLAHGSLMNMKAEDTVSTALCRVKGQTGDVSDHKGSPPEGIKIGCAIDIRIILASKNKGVGFRRHL